MALVAAWQKFCAKKKTSFSKSTSTLSRFPHTGDTRFIGQFMNRSWCSRHWYDRKLAICLEDVILVCLWLFRYQNNHKVLTNQTGVKILTKDTLWGVGRVWPGGSTEVVTRRHVGCACLAGRQSMQHTLATNTPTRTRFTHRLFGFQLKSETSKRLILWFFEGITV